MRWFEDFVPGEVIALGSHELEREEMLEFARRYDPQPFHVDEEAARSSPFGGLAASGWQVAAVWMRLYVDTVLRDAIGMGSPGVEELRWWTPVRPGDVLTGSLRVDGTAPSSKRSDRGTVTFTGKLTAAEDVLVMSMRGRAYFARHSTAAGGVA